MALRLLVLSVLLVIGVACDGYGDDEVSSEPSLQPATTQIDTAEGIVLVDTEVADSPEERARGLMNRKSLGDDEGMMFLYFKEHTGGYWMKDTLIPLSIAFFDHGGKILSILDMEPCEKEPCPIYDPQVSYWGALEVNQGAFDEWGVEVGDRIRSNQ
jgi:uncharacterized membrane protein (UPF0127 family)